MGIGGHYLFFSFASLIVSSVIIHKRNVIKHEGVESRF